MKLLTFEHRLRPALGCLIGDAQVLDLHRAAVLAGIDSVPFNSMIGFIEAGDLAMSNAHQLIDRRPEEALVALSSIQLLAPIPKPPRLRDTVMFLDHMQAGLDKWARELAAKETDAATAYAALKATGRYQLHPVYRDRVIYYNGDHLAVSGPDQDIHWPEDSNYMDFELEWAVVTRFTPRGTAVADPHKAIFGYTIFNDWSARDLQLEFMQANLGPSQGKDFTGSNGLGPWIVTADDIANPYDLKMTATVNNELWATGNTGSMHFRFEEAIEQFGRNEDIAAGEIIGSGTVEGGCGYEQGRKLADGDVVALTVEQIGTLRNRVVSGKA